MKKGWRDDERGDLSERGQTVGLDFFFSSLFVAFKSTFRDSFIEK